MHIPWPRIRYQYLLLFYTYTRKIFSFLSEQRGTTPLHLVSEHGHAALVAYLCDRGEDAADVNATDLVGLELTTPHTLTLTC